VTGPVHVNVYDEGLILTGALRVINGELPSRDFYTNYGPGQFALVAFFMSVLGVDTFTGRVVDAMQLAGAVLAAGLLLYRLTPLSWAIGGGLLVVHLFSFTRNALYPINVCILFVLCIAYVLVTRLPSLRDVSPCWAAIALLTLLGLFRYDLLIIGAVAFFVGSAVVLLLQWRQRQLDAASLRRIMFANSAAFLCVNAVAFGGLTAAGILRPAIYDILVYNTTNYAAMRNLPFPDWQAVMSLNTEPLLVYFAPFSIIGAIGALTILTIAANRQSNYSLSRDAHAIALIILGISSAFLYTKGLVRTSALHMLLANVPAMVLLVVSANIVCNTIIRRLGPILQSSKRGIAVLLIGRVIPLSALLAFVLSVATDQRPDRTLAEFRGGTAVPDIPAARGFSVPQERLAAVRHVMSITRPGERILSSTGRHDKVFLNDISFYFLSNRLPATRWHHYDPGVQSSEIVQRAIMADLENVRVVVRDRSWDNVLEPNRSAESSGITVLDRFLEDQFEVSAEFGQIVVLRRRAAGPVRKFVYESVS
jgi:hypothetical protein